MVEIYATLIALFLIAGLGMAFMALLRRPWEGIVLANFQIQPTEGTFYAIHVSYSTIELQPPLRQLRWRLRRVIEFYSDMVLWPAPVIRGIRYRSALAGDFAQQAYLRVSSRSTEMILVVGAVVQISFLLLLAQLTGPDIPLRIACYMVVIAVVVRPLGYWLGGSSVSAGVRRTGSNPYITLGIIAIGSLVAVILAAVLLVRWGSGESFHAGWLWHETKDVLWLRHIRSIASARSPSRIVIGVGAAIVVAQLLNPLRQLSAYTKTESETVDTAYDLARLGDIAEARKQLAIVMNGRDGFTTRAWRALAFVELVDHQLPAAWESIQRWLVTSNTRTTDYRLPDDAYLELVLLCGDIPRAHTYLDGFLALAKSLGVSDRCLYLVLSTAKNPLTMKEPLRWEECFSSAGLTSTDYPLTMTFASMKDGDRASLDQLYAMKCDDLDDEFVRLFALSFFEVSLGWLPQPPEEISRRSERAASTLQYLIDAFIQKREMPYWLRCAVADKLSTAAVREGDAPPLSSRLALLALRKRLLAVVPLSSTYRTDNEPWAIAAEERLKGREPLPLRLYRRLSGQPLVTSSFPNNQLSTSSSQVLGAT